MRCQAKAIACLSLVCMRHPQGVLLRPGRRAPRLLTASERKGSVGLARIRTRLLASQVELRVADNE